jgi:uncharacterized protein
MQKILFILATILLVSTLAKGNEPSDLFNNNNALKGLTTTKAYFDVTIGEPKQLLLRLQLIEKTYNQILAEGVTPTFIVGIRGKASNFFTKGNAYVLDIDLPEKKQIAVLVKKFTAMKIGIEQCGIASGFQDIAVTDFLPQVELVANGYTSMIGYQSQGYGFVAMD